MTDFTYPINHLKEQQ